MQKKIILFILLSGLLAENFPVYAQSHEDFDSIVDFFKTMQDYDLVRNPAAREQTTARTVLLVGTVSIISPSGSYDFLYTEEEIKKPAVFLDKFERPGHPVFRYLADNFSARTKKSLAEDSPAKKISTLLKDINTTLRKNNLYTDLSPAESDYPPYVKEYLQAGLADDEVAFLNRLLLDKLLTGVVRPVEITLELIRGEWLGYERVESYTCVIQISGPTAFRAFARRNPEESSSFTLPLNSRVLVAAQPKEIKISPFSDRENWFFTGRQIRIVK